MADPHLRFKSSLKDEVSASLERIKDRITQLRAQGAKPLLQGMAMGAGIAAFNAMGDAVANVTQWLGDSIGAAMEEEKGIARLTQAIKANVAGWNGNVDAVERVIASREKLAFADGEQRESLAVLVARTKDVTKALDLQRIAMDLARLKGIDLATASEVIGKAYSGNVGILTRYGIAVRKGADSTEALAAVQAAAAGQAEAFANTTEGSVMGMQIAIENLQEEIGTALLPVVRDLSQWARDEGVPALKEVVGVLKEAGPVIDALRFAATMGNSAIQDHVKATQEAAKTHRNFAGALEDTRDKARGAGNAIGGTGEAADDAKDPLHDLWVQVNKLGGAAASTRREMRKLEDSVEDALNAFLEATLGPEELEAKLAIAKDELRESEREVERTQRRIERFRESGKPVDELKDRQRELRLEIIEGKGEVVRLTGRLEAMGRLKPGSTQTTIEKLLGRVAALRYQASEAYDAMRALIGLQGRVGSEGNGGTGKGRQHRHAGGPVRGSFIAGEAGPELVRLGPSDNATVRPSLGGLPIGGPGAVIHINVSTPALTPGGAQALADAIGPHITRWQQMRGL